MFGLIIDGIPREYFRFSLTLWPGFIYLIYGRKWVREKETVVIFLLSVIHFTSTNAWWATFNHRVNKLLIYWPFIDLTVTFTLNLHCATTITYIPISPFVHDRRRSLFLDDAIFEGTLRPVVHHAVDAGLIVSTIVIDWDSMPLQGIVCPAISITLHYNRVLPGRSATLRPGHNPNMSKIYCWTLVIVVTRCCHYKNIFVLLFPNNFRDTVDLKTIYLTTTYNPERLIWYS